ncbi:MAG TPA: class I SAM-dependent methyltransferase [Victivallales bacterium]|nr:class I SAM-dependent methyltransferase [Victivallales bacterium]
MKSEKFKKWETFANTKEKYPKWPNETMLKVFFGDYLNNRIKLKNNMRILDVGCGFGNNLRPFLELGYDCAGTEVTEEMADITQKILDKSGYKTTIRNGYNTSLPFEDKSFDILLSVNVIHYETSLDEITKAFEEYSRVLRKGGYLFLSTVGETHDIKQKATLIENHLYEINDFDFRDGTKMFFFDTDKYLEFLLKEKFMNIEIGNVKERLMKCPLEFMIAVAQNK